ncbi:phage major capsid protein [Lysinibacillus sphaericus]|uniref:Phage major capsid protein n=1 Tax=Lysinibacillus sphaericus TaxID=1421 RepID=A0A544U7D3_LYSSH|nr:phage major capsid protein [Lysinibacillus sp. SDF0037]TQR26848.1 phage major capsid protein [Lysinibacillus sp. SDF0037]
MVMKLNNHTDAYEKAKLNYANVVKNEESTPEQVEEAWVNMQDALVNSLTTQITNEVANNTMDQVILSNRGADVMTAEETKFFNVVVSDGFQDEIVLPYTIEERIYEDLTSDHPLLSVINFRNLGTITLTAITSEYEGAAVWGPIFGDIKGQLNAAFKQEKIAQSKLTAFVVLPKDLAKFGPKWVAAYVQTQITETYAVALENAVINGAGPTKEEPIGLIRDLAAAVDPTKGHAKKAAAGELTLADPKTIIKEFAEIGKELSEKENGKPLNVSGKVALVINPADAWDLKGDFTIQNSLGDYITKLPYNFILIESEFATKGELVAFVSDRYDAYRGGGIEVTEYKETLAVEDCNLHIAKTFAFGKPRDNKVAAIYTLPVTP